MINTGLDAIIAPSRPVGNRLIFVSVSGITALDGSELNGTVESMFSTALSPFYSNAMRVKLMGGEFLTQIPDDTINQFVQFYSRQADFFNFVPENSALNPTSYASYRSRWVTVVTTISLLAGTSTNGMMQKRLGDLSVRRNRTTDALLNKLRKDLDDLTEILEDGGNYGRDIDSPVKGEYHEDTPLFGRLFLTSDSIYSTGLPIANAKILVSNRRIRKTSR